MITEPFKQAKSIIDTIERFHHEAYFVGGAVRDLLLGNDVNDIDIATSATPEQVTKIFKKVIPIGIEHGTVLVRYEGESYEVTTFREDGQYSDKRHPDDVSFVRKIDDDLKRRDFTINALAMDKNGEIIDLFNGEQDLKANLIRSVGHAKERFTEDPLRIIRALRFSSQLGFTIEEDTLDWMEQLKEEIEYVAVERITTEMTKFFQGDYVKSGLNYLIKTDIYKHLPIFKSNHQLINKLPNTLVPLHSFGEVICLFHFIYPSISINKWVKAWKCSNAIKKEAEQLLRALTYYERVNCDSLLVYQLDNDYFDGLCRLTKLLYPSKPIQYDELNRLYKSLPIKSRNDIHFNGNDLLKLFPNKRKGRWISEMIEQIEKEIILNNLANKHECIEEWVLCNPPEVN